MQVTFALSNKYRQDQFLLTGKEPPAKVILTVPTEGLSPESRQILIAVNPNVSPTCDLILPVWHEAARSFVTQHWEAPMLPGKENVEEWDTLLAAYNQAVADQKQAVRAHRQAGLDKLIADYQEMLAKEKPDYPSMYSKKPSDYKNQGLDRYDEAESLYQQVKALRTQQEQAKEAQARERERKIAEQKQVAEKDRADWIAQHATPMLQAKLAKGYDCNLEYARQRARMEHPGFSLDTKNEATWDVCKGPSDTAFMLAQEVSGEVVWLTAPPRDAEDYEDYQQYILNDFERGEAVVINNYLGICDLVHQM